MPGTDRRQSSTSSEDASLLPSRQSLPDGSEFIPTRIIKTAAPKPAANPLQFIKVGPCDLYKAAQEQIKKVEEIKKVEKVVKEDSQDWQSNLDDWKWNRRKRQEHIIERVVEVKKLELEEHERNRRRGKTLNEMMEERSSKGLGPRRVSLMTYPDEDPSDLTDLGISLADKTSSTHGHLSPQSSPSSETDEACTVDADSNVSVGVTEDKTTVPVPETEEYTYERAIANYKTYAERNKSGNRQHAAAATGASVNDKLNSLQQVRLRSNSTSDAQIPKVDIHKRRSLFEVVESADTKSPSAERIAKDLGGSKIVKERLSSLFKQPEVESVEKPVLRVADEINLTIKDRLTNLEKQNAEHEVLRHLSNDDINMVSIKDRLISLENGCKESVISSCSDEEMGHKELMSPAVSDREVSSPIVSFSPLTHIKTFPSGAGDTNIGIWAANSLVEADGDIVDCIGEGSNDSPAGNVDAVLGLSEGFNHKDKGGDQVQPAAILETPQVMSDSSSQICDQKSLFEINKSDTCQNNSNSSTSKTSPPSSLTTITDIDTGDTSKVASPRNEVKCHKVPKPTLRTRKLTPLLSAPTPPLSPVLALGDLHIISEDFPLETRIAELDEIRENGDEADEDAAAPAALPVRHSVPGRQGAETSESGIDMEESSLYTDENIDEVLGVDADDEDGASMTDDGGAAGDAHHVPDSASDLQRMRRLHDTHRSHYSTSDEASTRCDGPLELLDTKDTNAAREQSITMLDELVVIGSGCSPETRESQQVSTPEEPTVILTSDFNTDIIEPQVSLNFVASQLTTDDATYVNLKAAAQSEAKHSVDTNVYGNTGIASHVLLSPCEILPLMPLSNLEPPKEKPPPPPVDDSDDERPCSPLPLPHADFTVRRLDSTKRIKTEIRKKRSDFLGIHGANNDVYSEPDVGVEPPPDIVALLKEERRQDQQLLRQSICSETDSREPEQTKPALPLTIQKIISSSLSSEADWNDEAAQSRDSGVSGMELDRSQTDVDDIWSNTRNSHTGHTKQDDELARREREIIQALESDEKGKFRPDRSSTEDISNESLSLKLRQLEEEKLKLEWERAEEEGRRMADEERLLAKETLLRQQQTGPVICDSTGSQDNLRAERERLEQEQLELARVRHRLQAEQQRLGERVPLVNCQGLRQGAIATNLRYSMPDLQDSRSPVAATHPRSASSWSRIPSAENLLNSHPDYSERTLPPPASPPQHLSRSSLHALSAAPRSRIVNGETWMQPKRKTDAPKSTYNYQHWLIQEAEHRRITEQQQRATHSRRSLPNQSNNYPTVGRPVSGHFSPPYGSAPAHNVPYKSPCNQQMASTHTHSHSVPSHHLVGLPPSAPHSATPPPHPHTHSASKPLPEAVIQTLTQRVQNKTSPKKRNDDRPSSSKLIPEAYLNGEQERMLSVSGKKKCSHCGDELGRGAAMVIESLGLFYHIDCFKCCVCHTQLGDGLMGTDVRVRNNKLHCHNCYSSDDGVKFSCV